MNKKELIDHIETQRRFNPDYGLDDVIEDIKDMYEDQWKPAADYPPYEWIDQDGISWSGPLFVIKDTACDAWDIGVAYTECGKWFNEQGMPCDVIFWMDSPTQNIRKSQKVLID